MTRYCEFKLGKVYVGGTPLNLDLTYQLTHVDWVHDQVRMVWFQHHGYEFRINVKDLYYSDPLEVGSFFKFRVSDSGEDLFLITCLEGYIT